MIIGVGSKCYTLHRKYFPIAILGITKYSKYSKFKDLVRIIDAIL